MKKIWTIMLWMVLCTAPLFAFGQKEIPEGQKLEAATEGEGMPFDLYYTLEPGRVKLAWEWTEGIRYAFYVVNDEACRSVDSDRFEDVSEAAEKIYPSLSASKSTEAKSPSGIENLFVDSGSYQDGLLDTLNQSERDMLSYNKSMAEIEFLYEAASGDSFRLFLLKANGGFYEVRFDLSGGYFAGEREYITTGTGDTANKVRQLAFLSTFFGSEQNEFLNVAADSFDFTSTELTNARVQIGALENLKDLQNAFRVAFLDQLPIVEEKGSLPYFNVDEVGFEKIYGEHGAVYLKAYLAYLAKKNKPVLSRMYEKALGEESRYNYRDYEPLSDGKELAKAALRYLSWGCEYTVYLDSQFAFEPQSGNEVYKELVKDGNRDWIEAGKNGRSRATNYLPDSVGTVSLDSERLAAEHEGHEGVLKALFGYEEFTPLSGVTSLGLSADIPSFMAEGGNPLAYTPGGIDSPRTFNYKLHEQHRAMEWKLGDESFRSIPESTEAKVKRSWNLLDFGVEGRYEHYVSGEEVEEGSEYEGKEVKPFLPGYYRLGRGELEAIDGRCGVDGAGLVAGALAMTGDGVRFCGPDGEKVIENLDGYYGMSGERAGLKDGYPAYYPEEGGRIGAGGYRLRREDLEGSTVIIPELREVKAGDLLVRYEENGEVDLGIVVGVGWKEGEAQGLDNRELMEQVWVVTAKREFGMVSLGLWGNPNGRFGGFTDRPERYHVRRVLVKKEGEGSEGKRDGWELASYDLSGLKVDVSYEGERWIPNTKKRVEGKDEEEMEGIIVSRIEVKGSFEGGGSAQVLPQKRREVELLGVEDMYYEAGKGAETYGNIYNNQGSGIGLYSKEEGGEEHLIAKFERKEDGSYEVDYEGSYYGDEEGLGEEWAFLSDDEGRVWLEGRRGDGAGRIGRFVIKAIGDKICPGDDFLLSFGLSGEGEVRGRAEEGDFCGVYDKKLLWRANLYIGERGEDWNDRHPWNSEENEWNRYHDGVSLFTGLNDLPMADSSQITFNGESVGIDVPGGQNIKIFPYSPIRRAADDKESIRGRISYSYPSHPREKAEGDAGSMDSPFDFIKKMLLEKKLQHEKDDSWDSAEAPEGIYGNYERSRDGGTTAYLPGLGIYYYDKNHDSLDDSVEADVVGRDIFGGWEIEAGTDCIGFVQRSKSYDGNEYVWRDLMKGMTEYGNGVGSEDITNVMNCYDTVRNSNTRIYPYIGSASRKITSSNDKYVENDEAKFLNVEKLVPGDIFFYGDDVTGSSKGHHIAIVQEIEYGELGRETDIAKITLIESTLDGYIQYVQKGNSIENYNAKGKNWFLVRLMSK